jgi:hypothetical protein
MNSHLNPSRPAWNRLTAAARTWRDDRDESAPLGFSTRVAALALGQESRIASLFDLFALRALGVACLLAIVSVAMNYSELARRLTGAGDDFPTTQDSVAVVLALAD